MRDSYKVASFQGGLNRLVDPSQLSIGQTALLINGRVRTGAVETIKLPQEIGIPTQVTANLQGVYNFDTFALLFGNGKCYYRNFITNISAWYEVVGFSMDNMSEFIYACAVPASTVNFQRKAKSATDKSDGVSLADELTAGSTPACVVCQDGVNQPFVIFSDGTCRVTKTYADWDNTVSGNREYVPIGKHMVFANDKLYVAAKDINGKYTQLLQSVTGRPLDFVVNVTNAGDKGGDASTTAYQPSYSEITCLSLVGAKDGGFLVGTKNYSYILTPDYTRTIFGEPYYKKQDLFNTGPLNQFSVADLIGDTALIDFKGIRSFNAVLTQTNVGENSPFSAMISAILGNIVQSVACAATFDNYALFAINTVYGYGVLVYDTNLEVFVSLDIYSTVSAPIKQFAAIQTNVLRALFFITTDNKFYQAFTSATTAECGLYLGDFIPRENLKELKPANLQLAFVDVNESGTVTAKCFIDGKLLSTLSETIDKTTVASVTNLTPPFGNSDSESAYPVSFGSFDTLSYGWKVGYYITWNFDARLVCAVSDVDVRDNKNNYNTQARQYQSLNANLG